MGSDWIHHGEESYPDAAWLQLEVFTTATMISHFFQNLPERAKDSLTNSNFNWKFQILSSTGPFAGQLCCNIQLCFPTPGPQEVTAEARQLPLDYIGDQVRHKSTFIFISIISSNRVGHNLSQLYTTLNAIST